VTRGARRRQAETTELFGRYNLWVPGQFACFEAFCPGRVRVRVRVGVQVTRTSVRVSMRLKINTKMPDPDKCPGGVRVAYPSHRPTPRYYFVSREDEGYRRSRTQLA
jgi:hypothetical protein